jgi:heme-degrading monooxygenase HmoA
MEKDKKVMVEINFSNMSAEKYEQIWQDLRSAGHQNPQGLIHHAGAPTANNGLKVVDIWENEQKFQEFGKQTLQPILNKHGVQEAKPNIFPLHYEYKGIQQPE